MPKFLEAWKQKAHALKVEIFALYYAYRDPRTPWYARLTAAAVVAYAFSPIDLIPDFIPLLGYLDDLILLPLGAAFAIRLIPPAIMAEKRALAHEATAQKQPVNYAAAVIIILIWISLAAIALRWALQKFIW
jgi:uncharacterized membrane protein YkvA (DUF1232 family)